MTRGIELVEEGRTGVVDLRLRVADDALAGYVQKLAPKESISYNRELNTIDFSGIQELTRNEVNIIKYLFENYGQLCSKEDVGKVIWSKNEYADKYSEWAIDQAIFRLRKKLEKYNVDNEIETVHGRGYMLR